ncbi:MAG: hypothetical protein FD174_3939 [Geobacteraceae bacterium]|nr:MAG: hypothetical protein FD174_3939 [Geobacteraceae bacterium]
MQTNVILSIKNRTISIPYPVAEREDSPHNGFIPLKERPDEVPAIPAVEDNDALKQALTMINDSTTPFFTVACRKSFNSTDGSFWARGYLEFSFNYIEIAKDSPNYFLLFEQFNRHVLASNFDLPVDFKFELQGANFTDITADGYTACVWITTAEFPTMEGAYKTWNQSVRFLADFLSGFEKPPLPAIYEG